MIPVTINNVKYRSLSLAYREEEVKRLSGISYKAFRYRILAGWRPEHAVAVSVIPPEVRRTYGTDFKRKLIPWAHAAPPSRENTT